MEWYYIPLYANRVSVLSPTYEEKYWLMIEELLAVIEEQKQQLL